MDITQLHQKMIYPIVRVRSRRSAGSGVVIYSKPRGEDTLTYILTNFHVIESSVSFKDEWDGLAGRDVKTEIRAPIDIDIFRYRRLSWEEGQTTVGADIVAWDKTFDLALLQLRSQEVYPFVASFLPKDLIRDLRMGMETLTVGCSLGHKPIPSHVGMIESLDETVENQRWWMHSSPAIFGNSGGACYLVDRMEVFGITARIAVTFVGFSPDPITWLQYIIPISRVYNWLEEMHYDFIFDPSRLIEDCEKEREEHADQLRQAWETRFRREQEIAQGPHLEPELD